MNLRHVWLPPDGDPRLVRLQEDAAAALGLPGQAAVPPHLVLEPGQVPPGPLTLGTWEPRDGELVLPVAGPGGDLGSLRFGLPWTGTRPEALPPVPAGVWTRGRLGTLEVETVPGGVLWSWSKLSGWKSAPAKG